MPMTVAAATVERSVNRLASEDKARRRANRDDTVRESKAGKPEEFGARVIAVPSFVSGIGVNGANSNALLNSHPFRPDT
ncbi:MAG: hypothetical protein ACTHJR_18250 [Sphingomonas sp.]|uniref:hypothetical protein n=1 Tax=Sphingomonas sp. TaxID=28214 RepID=UPI003F7D7347